MAQFGREQRLRGHKAGFEKGDVSYNSKMSGLSNIGSAHLITSIEHGITLDPGKKIDPR